ncbi:MAG: L,D-transpeptidase family protein [Gammaproteobacteria bacterium]|nr:L,D-transpeptidase family protein [Gammaproteobacteria bacterium]MBP9728665.1 L,D-transpeptidase family protein [Gammaproteobacteria bacterium]
MFHTKPQVIQKQSAKILGIISVILLSIVSNTLQALTYTIPKTGNQIGQIEEIPAKVGDTLASIAERFSIGQQAMREANPTLKGTKLKQGTMVTIPSVFYLPVNAPRQGLVVNLSEMRAYYYHPDTQLVSTYPLCVGRKGWTTPRGTTTVVSKKPNPTWHPPASIKAEAEANGHPLPDRVAPGPHNPLGRYAIHLGIPGILIHGTTAPTSVGQRSSHGCMRMYATDIEDLFNHIPIGEVVHLIDGTHP